MEQEKAGPDTVWARRSLGERECPEPSKAVRDRVPSPVVLADRLVVVVNRL